MQCTQELFELPVPIPNHAPEESRVNDDVRRQRELQRRLLRQNMRGAYVPDAHDQEGGASKHHIVHAQRMHTNMLHAGLFHIYLPSRTGQTPGASRDCRV
jgi:hypothetical protein